MHNVKLAIVKLLFGVDSLKDQEQMKHILARKADKHLNGHN